MCTFGLRNGLCQKKKAISQKAGERDINDGSVAPPPAKIDLKAQETDYIVHSYSQR